MERISPQSRASESRSILGRNYSNGLQAALTMIVSGTKGGFWEKIYRRG